MKADIKILQFVTGQIHNLKNCGYLWVFMSCLKCKANTTIVFSLLIMISILIVSGGATSLVYRYKMHSQM